MTENTPRERDHLELDVRSPPEPDAAAAEQPRPKSVAEGGTPVDGSAPLRTAIAARASVETGAPATPEQYAEGFLERFRTAVSARVDGGESLAVALSGGLDSSAITALIHGYTGNRLETFSIAFADEAFDESGFQRQMAGHLGTRHHLITCTHADIGNAFPDDCETDCNADGLADELAALEQPEAPSEEPWKPEFLRG